MISINVRDSAGIREKLQELRRYFPVRFESALVGVADEVLQLAKSYAPNETSELRESGRVRARAAGTGLSVSITFGAPGDGAEGYALAVHEHPSEHDPPTWRGRQVNFGTGGPKYLERAVRESQSSIPDRVTVLLAKL